jgi:isoleucyl-tRNA synthetase
MYNFKEVEKKAKEKLEKNKDKIKRSLQDNQKKEIFSFIEGPPTANAPPGLHHFEVRTFKDIICKFWYMKGYSVPRKGGWDCHGLPVEVQIEKELGLNEKKDVLNYGFEKFIKKCEKSVFSYINEWNNSTRDLNYLIDLENPYITLKNDYIESVWWSLKEIYNKKLLYLGNKVIPFCPRCGTPLSSHEVAQGYKDVKEDSIYVFFKIKNSDNEYILVWTTTPWTLPGNVALAINPEINYVKVENKEGDKIILCEEKLKLITDFKIIEKFKGKKLIGLEYEPIYDIKKLKNDNSHKIFPADFVNIEEGTGIVHIAGMYGEDDYDLCKKFDLPEVHTVGQDGKFLEFVPKLKGKYVKDAEKDIILDLKKRNLLFKTEKITHSYPHCWRCNTPLLYYAINSWFVKVSKVKEKMVELNKKINWEPKHIKDGRFGNWLENAKDWSLSRFKFWGTPLPIWKCEFCGNEKIIGSIKELKENSIQKISKDINLHKPWIDKITLKCPSCGKEMKRVPEVIDCWYDSGSAPFAQLHYPFENKEYFKRRFPYTFISEAIDQTRGWFYTMHVLSSILFEKPAYKNVICAGHVVDEKGQKMSKSKGNIISPNEIMEKTGIDAIRSQFCTSDTGSFKPFSYNLVKKTVIPFLNVLYNLNNYYNQLENKKILNYKIEDKWIISKLNSLIKDVTFELNNYHISNAFSKIMEFVIKDFSRGYIRLTRERKDNKEIIEETLKKITLILAPFIPYLTEYIYDNFSKKSVHLSNWPKLNEKLIDKKLEDEIEEVLKIIEIGLKERDFAKIGLKWPLISAEIISKININNEFEEIIKKQLSIKKLICKKGENISLKLNKKINKELEQEGYSRELSRQIQAFRKKMGLNKKDKINLNIFTEDKELIEIIKNQKENIKEKANLNDIIISENIKIDEERFKNNIDFKIKDKRGKIGII